MISIRFTSRSKPEFRSTALLQQLCGVARETQKIPQLSPFPLPLSVARSIVNNPRIGGGVKAILTIPIEVGLRMRIEWLCRYRKSDVEWGFLAARGLAAAGPACVESMTSASRKNDPNGVKVLSHQDDAIARTSLRCDSLSPVLE